MGLFTKKKKTEEKSEKKKIDGSILISNEKIDRHGMNWKKKEYWFQKEYLNKLKVIAHFKSASIQTLINVAIGEYIEREFDKSQVFRKLVAKSTGKVKIKV